MLNWRLDIGMDKKLLEQFIKFGLVGVTNTAVNYIVNTAVLLILNSKNYSYDYIVANIIAFIISTAWAFLLNNKYVFKSTENRESEKQKKSRSKSKGLVIKSLIKCYLAYGFTGIILNNILSWLWINKFGISKFIAPLLNLVFSVPLNFIINKLWTFNDKE